MSEFNKSDIDYINEPFDERDYGYILSENYKNKSNAIKAKSRYFNNKFSKGLCSNNINKNCNCNWLCNNIWE